jgi:hypothetical protein
MDGIAGAIKRHDAALGRKHHSFHRDRDTAYPRLIRSLYIAV